MNLGAKLILFTLASILLVTSAAFSAVSVDQAQTNFYPDLVSFPFDHNILPEELIANFKSPSTDLRKVASSLMERKRQFILRWEDPNLNDGDPNFPNSLDEVELVCAFPEQYLDSLFKNGQLNLHQVGHTRGVCEPALRAHAEDYMIGIHLESKYDDNRESRLHYLRPKYAYLHFLKPCGIKVNPARLLQYGQVLIVYNDAVKMRSSYTYGDSLASYCEPWAITMHPLDPVPLTLLSPPGKYDKPICRFVEAQIWGPIDLSDIKEFRIPKERKDLLEKLSATGKPVFSYDREKMELIDTYVDVADCGWKRGEALNQTALELAKNEQKHVAQK